jgi:hypothetical protein
MCNTNVISQVCMSITKINVKDPIGLILYIYVIMLCMPVILVDSKD